MIQSKSALRKDLLMARSTVPTDVRSNYASKIVTHSTTAINTLHITKGTIACYLSMGTEIPTTDLLDTLLAENYRIIVPSLGNGSDVLWAELPSLEAIQTTQTHRPPEVLKSQRYDTTILRECAMVIIPALAVDKRGMRLGRGGGWYDRALLPIFADNAKHSDHNSPNIPQIPIFAIVNDTEVFDVLPCPVEEHDIPINGYITPSGMHMIRQ